MKQRSQSVNAGAVLWASAFVILALILVQAGRLPAAENAAMAGDVSSVGELTILTAETGGEQDAVYVLDSVNGLLLIYNVQNRASIELVQSYSVPRLFTDARAAAGLRPATP